MTPLLLLALGALVTADGPLQLLAAGALVTAVAALAGVGVLWLALRLASRRAERRRVRARVEQLVAALQAEHLRVVVTATPRSGPWHPE